MRKVYHDRRYGFFHSCYVLARACRFHEDNYYHKMRGRQWFYPSEPERVLALMKKIREGRVRLKRMGKGQKARQELEVVDPPRPPVQEQEMRVSLDFRGVRLGIMPAAPPPRGIPTPQGVFGRAPFWAPRRG